MSTQDNTRYQILWTGKPDVENFTAKQKAQYLKRQKELKAAGVKFTVWDCLDNSMSRFFGGI